VPVEKRTEEDDMVDLWAAPAEVISKSFDHFKTGFAKRDHSKVKSVIMPVSGMSYNPSNLAHKNLLHHVADAE